MKKYIVFKKVLAQELIFVEGEDCDNAIKNASKGEGVIAKSSLEWQEDCDTRTWMAEPIDATDEELEELRNQKKPTPQLIFTDYEGIQEDN